jgi:hypothetical protein
MAMSSSPSRRWPHRIPIVPSRVRDVDRRGGFAFVPNRFLHDGFFTALSDSERSLYLFLVLAGDRNGVSYYHFDRICAALEVSLERYIDTRNSLIKKDLIAYDGIRFQVLALPDKPPVRSAPSLQSTEDFEEYDPATIRQCIVSSLKKS